MDIYLLLMGMTLTDQLSEQINSNTAKIKLFNQQAKATYFQSLVNEIKSLEKDIMLYGFKIPEGVNCESSC